MSPRDEWEKLTLGDRVLAVMAELNLEKQEDFAEAVGTSRWRVSAWVNGRSTISRDYADRLAELSGWPVEAFLPRRAGESQQQVVEAAQAIVQVGTQVAEALERLGELLQRQEAVVGRLETALERLARLTAANGDG